MGCNICFGKLCGQERENQLKGNGRLGFRKSHCDKHMSEDTLQLA